MNRLPMPLPTRGLRAAIPMIVSIAGIATAVAVVGVALAKTFTLQVANSAKVTNQTGATKTESIVVTPRGFAVYELTGDSKRHPECTKGNGCFSVWPPVTVPSPAKLSKAAGIKGKLGVWHRNGFFQVILAGHPLYRFAPDSQRDHATGEGIRSFGGTWHVLKEAGSSPAGTTTSSGASSTMTTTTTSTTCAYPGYC